MTTDELRQRFLRFFASKGHKIYSSDTLVPKDDPTLLFTSAGMNQFKQEFLSKPAKYLRRATCQKCLRTGDLDKVGRTNSHHTFFEMLGNFSFGDYFKDEAIVWAWEFVTKELSLPEEKLWVSVYQEDEEAYNIWKDKIGVGLEKVVKLGAKENFWPSNAPEEGPNGPCGPCSEIFYDLGKDIGCGRPECSPACSCGRFVEAWNLVFTQFERQGKNKLAPLPSKNIDTGMGLERMAAVLQGKPNNFEIDIFARIIKKVGDLAASSPNLDSPACKIIADHIRAVTFAIADGILPSNKNRGYVIRKLIRRAIWYGQHAVDIKKPCLYKIVPVVCSVMKVGYPEIAKQEKKIQQVVKKEEERFHKAVERATKFSEEIITDLKKQGKNELSGEEAFRLYETYGLPEEMLKVLVASRNFGFDAEGFAQELKLQRDASRQASNISESVFVGSLVTKFKIKPTKFVGDKSYSVNTKISALFKDDQPIEEATAGDEAKIVLESTPFYAESGGQIGDTGLIKNKGATIKVFDTHKVEQVHLHLGTVSSGVIKVNDKVEAEIDKERRENITRNHTATHLLQAALRKVLGEHVRQAGSWVGPDRLRFDFTHFQALNERQLARVEALVNEVIKQDKKLEILQRTFEQAQKAGALAFFGEKYQEKVRVIRFGNISSELCGGMHVSSTGEIGIFKITGESSAASGIRRIEAVTARAAREVIRQKKNQLQEFTKTFGALEDNLPGHIENLLQKLKGLNRRLDKTRIEAFKLQIDKIILDAQEISGVKIIVQEIKSADMELLRLMADLLRQKMPSLVILASLWEGKVFMVCALSKDLLSQGLDAVKIIRKAAEDIGGSGGGRSDFAQAGGNNPQGISKALMRVKEIVEKELKQ